MSIPHFFIADGAKNLLGLPFDVQSQDSAGDCASCADCVVSLETAQQNFTLRLPQEVVDHMHTCRMRAGERFVLVDAPGHGFEFELITAPNKKNQHIDAALLGERTSTPPPHLTLVQAISTADRMDQTIRQATELGVSRIFPVESERSTVQLTSTTREKKQERWRRIARGAAEQSGQLRIPQIELPLSLAATLELLKGYDALLFFWEEGGGLSVTDVLGKSLKEAGTREINVNSASGTLLPRVALFIGPEGGFSIAEAELIKAAGAKTVTLGETILRTETAAVVASALVLYQLGALGAS